MSHLHIQEIGTGATWADVMRRWWPALRGLTADVKRVVEDGRARYSAALAGLPSEELRRTLGVRTPMGPPPTVRQDGAEPLEALANAIVSYCVPVAQQAQAMRDEAAQGLRMAADEAGVDRLSGMKFEPPPLDVVSARLQEAEKIDHRYPPKPFDLVYLDDTNLPAGDPRIGWHRVDRAERFPHETAWQVFVRGIKGRCWSWPYLIGSLQRKARQDRDLSKTLNFAHHYGASPEQILKAMERGASRGPAKVTGSIDYGAGDSIGSIRYYERSADGKMMERPELRNLPSDVGLAKLGAPSENPCAPYAADDDPRCGRCGQDIDASDAEGRYCGPCLDKIDEETGVFDHTDDPEELADALVGMAREVREGCAADRVLQIREIIRTAADDADGERLRLLETAAAWAKTPAAADCEGCANIGVPAEIATLKADVERLRQQNEQLRQTKTRRMRLHLVPSRRVELKNATVTAHEFEAADGGPVYVVAVPGNIGWQPGELLAKLESKLGRGRVVVQIVPLGAELMPFEIVPAESLDQVRGR